MIARLGHEAHLRRLFGFPRALRLWGTAAHCYWRRRKGPGNGDLWKLERRPEAAFEASGLEGLARLSLVDDLLAHAKFGAGMTLAAYLASIPWIQGERKRGGHAFDLGIMAVLRLKEAQAATEGGYYARARALLVQLESMARALPPGDGEKLIRANVAMLWGRLLQLWWLSRKSLQYIAASEAAFRATPWGIPAGFELLRIRSSLLAADPDGLSARRRPVTPTGESIFGGLEDHYAAYLDARAAHAARQLDRAENQYRKAMALLTRDGHCGLADPIRAAYTNLGLGQVLLDPAFGDAAGAQEGIRLVLQAQWQFEYENNPHGEYLAHSGYGEVSAPLLARDEESTVQALKAEYRRSLRSQVPRFQLESGLAWARALYDYGRPNRMLSLIGDIEHVVDDELADELKATLEWDALMALKQQIRGARENSVDPRAAWGISEEAREERDFVLKAIREKLLVTVFGPPGSGRRLLVSRIARARGQDAPEVLDARTQTLPHVLENLARLRAAHEPVILHNFDLWQENEQVAALRAITGGPAWQVETYITLRRTAAVDSELGDKQSPRLSEALIAGGFTVKPLERRPQDTLLLARGYLVQALEHRRKGRTPRSYDPRDVVFTSAACRYIREHYRDVRTLNRHMRDLAFRLRDSDLIVARDDRRRIPVEVVRKLMDSPPRLSVRKAGAAGDQSDALTESGLADLDPAQASQDALHRAARKFRGRIATAARAFGMPATTFRKLLESREALEDWKTVRSRARAGATEA